MAGEESRIGAPGNATDDDILNAIFNPSAPIYAQTEPSCREENRHDDTIIRDENLRRAKEMELMSVRAAEEGSLDEALRLIDEAVKLAAYYASLYNNRAQVSFNRQFECHHIY